MKSNLNIPSNLLSELQKIGLNPKDLVLYINSECNLRCKHCYIGNDLLSKDIKLESGSIIKFLGDFDSLDRITVLGGEPFLYKDINLIVDFISKIKVKERRITSNLTTINDATLNLLKGSNFRISVSLDGYSKEIHEYIRGKDTFYKTIGNINLLLENNIDVEVTCTINKYNFDSFDKYISFIREIGINKINLHKISLKGNTLKNRSLEISPTEWRMLIDGLGKEEIRNNSIAVRYELGYVNAHEYEELIKNKDYKPHAFKSYYSEEGHRVVIYPDGKIYVSSEAFGTESYIASFINGKFIFNDNSLNELTLSTNNQFITSLIDKNLIGDEKFPIPLSFSYRKTSFI